MHPNRGVSVQQSVKWAYQKKRDEEVGVGWGRGRMGQVGHYLFP